VPAQEQFLALPPGHYSSILLLPAAALSGHNEGGLFKAIYQDGNSLFETDETLGFSDWQAGYNQGSTANAPGETTVKAMTAYDTYSGGSNSQAGGNAYLYGYTIPVDPTRTLIQLGLTNDQSIVVLALDLASQPPQVNMGYGTNTTRLPFGAIGITTALDPTLGALDSAGESYAAGPKGLGNTVTWGTQTFAIGPAGVNDVMPYTGGLVTLPAGNFTSLKILAAATGSGHFETGQLDVYYVGGSYDTFTQDFSDWKNGYVPGAPGSTARARRSSRP
jgi:hypothetical protein